jgi:hypothetical protein
VLRIRRGGYYHPPLRSRRIFILRDLRIRTLGLLLNRRGLRLGNRRLNSLLFSEPFGSLPLISGIELLELRNAFRLKSRPSFLREGLLDFVNTSQVGF